MTQAAIVAALLFAATVLYTSVGHGGASGYLAALALNILVTTIATTRYARAGAFTWRDLWPFLIGLARAGRPARLARLGRLDRRLRHHPATPLDPPMLRDMPS